MNELNDAEYWVLLSLDAESALHELLMPIVVHEGDRARHARPALDIAQAAGALASLSAQGYAEVRLMDEDVDWDNGRAIDASEVAVLVCDPANWSVSSDSDPKYWAAATDEGEAAYRRASELRRMT